MLRHCIENDEMIVEENVNNSDTQETEEVTHLDSLEVMILANKAYIRGQLIQIGKVGLIDPIIVQAEKHLRTCKECRLEVKQPRKPISISKSDWLSLLSK